MLAEPIAFSSRACPEKGNVSGRRREEVKKILRLFLFTAFFLLTAMMQAQTVYITKTGAKYHKESCRYAKTGWASDLAAAKKRGLTAWFASLLVQKLAEANPFRYLQDRVRSNQLKKLSQLKLLPSVVPPLKRVLDAQGNPLQEVAIAGSMMGK